MRDFHCGTSGWSYPQWKSGFYAPGSPAGEWLSQYARHLPSVELNSSFYRPPSHVTVQRWCGHVPETFRFAVKAWKAITHEARLRDCTEALDTCLRAYREFGMRKGPLLFQLPPSLVPDDGLLKDFLLSLPGDIKTAFEFRHPGWQTEATYARLADVGAALCLAHMRDWMNPFVVTAPFAYVRLHGSDGWFAGRYSGSFLEGLADRLLGYGVSEAWMFLNNTRTGVDAPTNAADLIRLMQFRRQ